MARSGDFYTDYISNSEDAERGAPLDTVARYWSERRWGKVIGSSGDSSSNDNYYWEGGIPY